LVASGLHSGPLKIMNMNSIFLGIYNSYNYNRPEPFSFEIFGKSFSNQILVEQGNVQLLLEKPYHFSEKKSQQSKKG
jgi:hypothetical protein